MNSWLTEVNNYVPAVLTILFVITALLMAGIAVQHAMRRSSAARHAVLLWTLIAVGLCPFLISIVRLASIPAPIASRVAVQRMNVLFGSLTTAQTAHSNREPIPARHLPLSGFLLALWATGTLVSLLGLARGLRITRRIRRSAQRISAERIEPACSTLLTIFGRNLPRICTSDQVAIPMAVGYVQPLIVLPSSLLGKLNDQQLLQVLIHECAHARRRDALVALYQGSLVAIFWFHPLVYLASRLLNRVREEICDNYVLGTASAKNYAQTLLTIAESISTARSGWFAPALIQSGKLEGRIASLLQSRRCRMTKLTPKKLAAIAMSFVGCVIILSTVVGSFATAQASDDFSHVVNLKKTASGDLITITEVRGPSDTLEVGKTYEVRGTYKLVSQDKALLSVGDTTERFQPGESHPGVANESHPPLPRQKVIVEKGEGAFTLQFYMTHGQPHVSFYPLKGGSGFAGRNFGNAILYPGQ
jgi:beta-lactamase regulating signal transducer with metallopeptidase domain